MAQESIARQMHGKDWKEVEPFIRQFQPYTGLYLLKDGSLCKRLRTDKKVEPAEAVHVVHFHDDGIHVRQANRNFRS